MLKCFLCGAEYDENARKPVISMLNIDTNQITEAKTVMVGESATLMLCPNCTRASIFGNAFGNQQSKWKPIVNVELEPTQKAQSDEEEGTDNG